MGFSHSTIPNESVPALVPIWVRQNASGDPAGEPGLAAGAEQRSSPSTNDRTRRNTSLDDGSGVRVQPSGTSKPRPSTSTCRNPDGAAAAGGREPASGGGPTNRTPSMTEAI